MKARKIKAFALSFLAAAAIVSGVSAYQPLTVFAADKQVAAADEVTEKVTIDAKVISQANGTVTLGWEAEEGADRYAAYEMTADGKQELKGYADNGKTEFTFTGVTGNVTHKYVIVAEKKVGDDYVTNCEFKETEVAQPLYAPEFALTPAADSVKISWKESVGATNYRIYSYDPTTKKYKRIHTSYPTTRSYTVKGLTPANGYSFVVRAVSNVTGKTVFDKKMAAVKSTVTKCVTPKFTSLSSSINTVTAKWNTSGDVAGYQVWVLDNATGKYKKVSNVSKSKLTYSWSAGVTLNKSLKVKVRAYKKYNGAWVYSSWSAVKAVTPKITAPAITSLATSGANVNIGWSASDSGIDGYQVWMKADGAEKYVKLCNVSPKKLSKFINDGVPASTLVKLRMRAYKKIDGVWKYSAWSAVKEMKTGEAPLAKTIKIVLDPGHLKGLNAAGNDYDNVYMGYSEATMSLTLAKYMKAYLEDYGFEVKLTRETDQAYNLDLNDRGRMAEGYDFLLSLHSNAAGETAQAVYAYCSIDKKSNALGKLLSAAVAKTMGVPDGGVVNLYSDDGVTDYYCVLRNAAKVGVSSIMVEHSYHTNTYSREWLLKESNLKKLAAAEARVLAEYYGMI
ncbi:MAG: N-acetylmuramoyl-L-alanine amidase [Ruminococcus sp.]|nr:N-acetylmuramoyl-L-alanine amidase [Ruminococcus sp.]